jgi:hypothetical protein
MGAAFQTQPDSGLPAEPGYVPALHGSALDVMLDPLKAVHMMVTVSGA